MQKINIDSRIKDKFCMPVEENIFIAKRLLVDSIYQQANLEGIAATYAQTIDILNNVNVASLTPNEINKICCLRDGWHYVLDNLDAPLDLVFIETLHEFIARFDVPYMYLGKLRTEEVLISGTSWRPPVPNVDSLYSWFSSLTFEEYITDAAIKAGLRLMRVQPFKDGNKRIGSFMINKILIQHGKGLFNVPVNLDGEFKQRLVTFYESNECQDFVKWIADNCIIGL